MESVDDDGSRAAANGYVLSEWIDVGPVSAVHGGEWLTTEVDGRPIAVVRVGGTLYAFEDRCTHDGESLAGAAIEDHQVICPRHGARFSLCTGAALAPPAYEPVKVFAVREAAGRISIEA